MQNTTVYQQLAQSLGQEKSQVVADIFKTLADENEAAVLMAASPPKTIQELATQTGLDESNVKDMIEPMFRKGLLFKSRKPDAERYYRVRNVMQFHDSAAVTVEPPAGLMALWHRWTKEEWPAICRSLDEIRPSPAVRVIPVNVTIDYNSQVLAIDDVANLVERARNIAVTKCSCRAITGCKHTLDACFQLDKAADYAIERGTGRQLTKPEAMKLLMACEEEGLVHTIGNSAEVGTVICNCCSDCCIYWTSIREGLGKFIAPSRFLAVVNEDECTGCELCIERCYFDAMHMVDGGGRAAVHAEKCLGCGLCQVVCTMQSISMEEVRPPTFIPAHAQGH